MTYNNIWCIIRVRSDSKSHQETKNQQKEVGLLTDTERLRDVIKVSGFKLQYLARQLGLSPYGFTLKLENKNEFKPSEILKLCEILNITDLELKESIFFTQNSDK